MRILIVEDEPTLGQQLKSTLEQGGYAVDLSTDGEDGHFLGATEDYDAVILDLGLPEVDGLTVLDRWRREGIKVPVLVLTALGTLGVAVSPFVASLGIGGVAVALALQNVLGDLFASLSIVFDKPFVVGDSVAVDDFSGTVEYVGLKTTRIRSISGEQLVFANSDLLASRLRNYGRMRERRVIFTIGVTYGTPSEALRAIPRYLREAIERLDNTRFDRSHLKEFGDSSIDFETVYHMVVPDYNAYMDTQEQISLALYERFEAQGIDFAFPTRTVRLVGADGVVDNEEAGESPAADAPAPD